MDLLKKYDDPQLVASTLIGQGFRLYRGVLEDADFSDLLRHVVKENKKIGFSKFERIRSDSFRATCVFVLN